ncbi:type II secretion system F family protein [bacterium]|nr:type II secretion system F family protein [bacterium]
MPVFSYKAKQGPKKVISGVIEAENQDIALSRLDKKGYFVLSISAEKEKTNFKSGLGIFQRINLKHISLFTRQLSDLLDAGVPLLASIDILSKQADNTLFGRVLDGIYTDIKDGKSLSESLAKYPKLFSPLYINMVASGETGGILECVLSRLADFYEKEDEIKSKIKAALTYPIFMFFAGISTIIVLLTFVIPKLVVMFEDMGQKLPLPTRVLVSSSSFIVEFWWVPIAIIFLVVILFKRLRKTSEGGLIIDKWKLTVPLAGKLVQKVEISRFSRTLATLLENGVPILQSLNIVKNTIVNKAISGEIDRAAKDVSEGNKLAASLGKGVWIPIFVTNMIAVGEESGSLEKTLLKISDTYARQVDKTTKTITSLLEPAMILIMGSIVGFIVISMLLPIFQINILIH